MYDDDGRQRAHDGGGMTDTTSETVLRGERALWRLEEPIPAALRTELGGRSPMLCHLLYCRGLRAAAEIERFFSGEEAPHDPWLLPDMDAAVDRIAAAVESREQVAVYGDFDCDGIMSAAILVSTLQSLGLDPIAHIPERVDGHGLHPEALAYLADHGVSLIVTADCGVGAIEEVRVAQGMGMDVIITDHHEARVDGSLPACPTVTPTRHDSEYPFRYLCGAGVAYKLTQALADRLPGAPNPDELLDLVALGTVADVVPMVDENRWLVIRGLKSLKRTQRPGLLALFEVAGVDRGRIDPISIGYYLAPRINAANRMATPQLAYDCVTASDPVAAAALAKQLSEYNQKRQALVAAHLETTMEQIGSPARTAAEIRAGLRPPILIVTGDWQAGISGLLASKLVDVYGLPAFVGSDGGADVVAVSARGTPGVRIDEILEACEAALPGGLFLGYGGHARAGGFRVGRESLQIATEILEEQALRHVHLEEIGAVLTVDAEVPLRRVTLDAARQVATLAPFGVDFLEPLCLSRNLRLTRVSGLGDNKHARFRVEQEGVCIDGVYFGVSPSFLSLPPRSTLDVVFHIQLDEWQGYVKPVLRLRDWRPADRV